MPTKTAARSAKKTAVAKKTPVARKAAPAAKRAKPKAADASVAASAKPAKAKLVRDSFTIPKSEYVVLDDLKQRAGKLARPAKKSELLRAGIKALAAMSDAKLLAALQAVPAIKTGRPKSKKSPDADAAAPAA